MAGVAGEDGDAAADLMSGLAPEPLAAELLARAGEAPAEAEVFQLVRLILEAGRRAGAGRARIGGDDRPVHEPLRFRAAAGQGYPSAELVEASLEGYGKAELTVAFMGLTGPSGVLPDHYSDLVVQRRRARDPAFADFLDLFNHRAISLFYRAWAKPRLPVRFQEAQRPLGDPFSRALAAVIGLGLNAQRPRAALGEGGLLGLAGTLGRRVRTPGAVRRLVAALLPMPVEVREFHGRWIDIAPADRTRLSAPRPGERSFSSLGVDAVAGSQVFDVQSRFRVRLGPMGLAEFQAFFRPEGPRRLLEQVVREAVGPAIDFDLQLVLRHEDTPSLRLDDAKAPALLGQTTWLGAAPVKRDRDEAVLAAGRG